MGARDYQRHPLINGLDVPEFRRQHGYALGVESPDAPTPEDVLAIGWRATAGEGRDLVIVTITPSIAHPGFCDYRRIDIAGAFEDVSIKPVRADVAVEFALHGIDRREWAWKAFEPTPAPVEITEPKGPRQVRAARVYFMVGGPFVKIGFSVDPESRLATLQTGSPHELRLAASVPGTIEDEHLLHRRFAEYRVRADGEWFRHEGALAEYIRGLQ